LTFTPAQHILCASNPDAVKWRLLIQIHGRVIDCLMTLFSLPCL
jgi:hypothetical protein